MKLGDVSISYVDVLIKAMQYLDCPYEDILKQYSISPNSLSSPDALLSIPKFMRLGHSCINKAQAPWLGLLMGKLTTATNLGFAGLMACSAKTLQQALEQLVKYELLNSYNVRGASSLILPLQHQNSDSNHAQLRFYSISPYNQYNYFVVDLVLSGWYQLIFEFIGDVNDIISIHFECSPPKYIEHYKQFFHCEVLFNQPENMIKLDQLALCKPCLNHSASTFELLQRHAEASLKKANHPISFADKVARVIAPLLQAKTPKLEQVAEQLNMPAWTVRRKLVEQGSGFQQVLNQTRQNLAITYIKETELSLAEISYLLGFNSPTAFQRAFKRWQGVAPGQYRLEQQKY